MNDKTYKQITGVIFFITASMHALRLLMGWSVVFAGWAIPMWASVLAIVVTGYLAYQGLKK